MRYKTLQQPKDQAEKGRARAHDNHACRALEKALERKRVTESTLKAFGMRPDRSIEEMCRG
jgi:hypothetical protein